MRDMLEIIKRAKRESIVLSLIIILFCLVNLILSMDFYKKLLIDDYTVVTDAKSLSNAIEKNERYIYIDLSNANLEHYSISNEDNTANIYTLKYDDNYILVLLKENTIITNKTPVEIINDNYTTLDIKKKFEKVDYLKISLSNIEYKKDLFIEKVKLYLIICLLILSGISIIINFYGLLNPKKTISFKSYVKKN